MRFKLHPVLLVAMVLALCAAVVGAVAWLRFSSAAEPKSLLAHIPDRDASPALLIDFEALRESGLLALLAAPDLQEPEYKEFVLATGFNYQEDLDLAIVSFQPQATFFLLRGRFDWDKLADYVRSQEGNCLNTFCRMSGSTPDRRVSFFPLRFDVLALAVSRDPYAAGLLADRHPAGEEPPLPLRPVWLTVPGSYLRTSEKLPAGLRLFAKAAGAAPRVLLALDSNRGEVEALLEAECLTEEEAASLAGQLQGLTAVLRDMIARENHTPNPRDLSGVLTGGSFRSDKRLVTGHWPLPKPFLDALAGSSQ